MSKKKTKDRILELIASLRPYINADGGDLEFISYKDGIVTIKMTGACANCAMAPMTFDGGVKNILLSEIKELQDVIFIN